MHIRLVSLSIGMACIQFSTATLIHSRRDIRNFLILTLGTTRYNFIIGFQNFEHSNFSRCNKPRLSTRKNHSVVVNIARRLFSWSIRGNPKLATVLYFCEPEILSRPDLWSYDIDSNPNYYNTIRIIDAVKSRWPIKLVFSLFFIKSIQSNFLINKFRNYISLLWKAVSERMSYDVYFIILFWINLIFRIHLWYIANLKYYRIARMLILSTSQ